MSPTSNRIWLLLQGIAMAAALVAPTLLPRSPSLSERRSPAKSAQRAPASISARPVAVEAALSMSSHVLVLPDPESASNSHEYTVTGRQLRLERPSLGSPPFQTRKPASLWQLKRIAQRSGNGPWNNVPLLRGDEEQALGTSYIELFDGRNDFEIEYGRGRNERRLLLLRVQRKAQNP